jgi:uncharacterized protein with NRDE domain
MCIAFVATDVASGRFPLVLALNRDESPHRPTAKLHEWDFENCPLIAGRDLQSHGTWFGYSPQHLQFAVLTNRRRRSEEIQQVWQIRRHSSGYQTLPKGEKYTSRGLLVCDVLRDGIDFSASQSGRLYQPFNLLLGSADNGLLVHVSEENVSLGGKKLTEETVYAMTNAGEMNPPWPKAVRGKQLFRQVLSQEHSAKETAEGLAEQLFAQVLMDSKTFQLAEQPQEERAQGDDVARVTGSIFIPKNEVWHTLSSTVLVVDQNKTATIVEWTHPTCQSPNEGPTKTCIVSTA